MVKNTKISLHHIYAMVKIAMFFQVKINYFSLVRNTVV